jgi:predicted DNA-binding transcriptional regulator YafY
VAEYGGNEALVQSLCELIRFNAALNVQEMADALQVSKRTLERLMAQLKQQGVIRRVGSARSGIWQVV